MFGFSRKPFAQLTATTNAGTFRWVQRNEHAVYYAFILVGRSWVAEHRLDAVSGEQIGYLLRDLGWE